MFWGIAATLMVIIATIEPLVNPTAGAVYQLNYAMIAIVYAIIYVGYEISATRK
jgi:hypothetical protein